MASVNQATVIGFIGEEPRINTLSSGRKVASFTVATTEKGYTTQSGVTYPDRTEWHNIVLWGKLAEIAERYLHKGSSVYVQGKMRSRSYDDKNGVKRYITEIEGDTIQMLDRRGDGNQQAQPQNAANPNNPATNKKDGGGSDDDLPF